MSWYFSARPLDVPGHDGPLPLFRRQERHSRHLAVLFPGRGYGCEMPLLHYAGDLLDARGADVLGLRYDFRDERFEDLGRFEARLEAAVDPVVRAGLRQRERYDRVTLVGKSLGTWAMGCLLARAEHPLHSVKRLDTVWLTPSLRFDPAWARLRAWRGRSLWILGEADEHHVLPVVDRVQTLASRPAAHLVPIPSADHGLSIPGDTLASIRALERVMKAVQEHLDLTGS